jgi:hypothetical protein
MDTLAYTKALEARGIGRAEAERLAEEQAKIMAKMPDKSDMDIAIERAVHTLTIRLFGFLAAFAGLTVPIILGGVKVMLP